MVGVVNLAVLACVLRATTKKSRQHFWARKVQPRENPAYTPMLSLDLALPLNG